MKPLAQQVCAQFDSPHVPAAQLSARVMPLCSAPQSLLLAHEAHCWAAVVAFPCQTSVSPAHSQHVWAQFCCPHEPGEQLVASVEPSKMAPQSLLVAHWPQASFGVPQSTAYVLSTDEQGGLTPGANGGDGGGGGAGH